jgi:hypothetical protein
MVAASKLNTTTIQFSNWPLADGYISSFNIPGSLFIQKYLILPNKVNY